MNGLPNVRARCADHHRKLSGLHDPLQLPIQQGKIACGQLEVYRLRLTPSERYAPKRLESTSPAS